MTFVNKDGEMIAICEGEILKQLNEKDKLKQLIKWLIKDLNEERNERHDDNSSASHNLTQNMQTSVAAVEQQNVDSLS